MFKQSFRFYVLSICLIAISISSGWLAKSFWSNSGSAASAQKPLYWVAPMDDNYRRDKPGKSPMGMDLVPVYAQSTSNREAGVVTISPTIENNLGVRSEAAKKIQLQYNIKTVGFVQYDENKLIHIHPRVAGWVEKLHIKSSGDPVKKGQALYALYSPELVNAQQEYIAELNRNNTVLITAAEARLRALQVSQKTIIELKKNKTVKQSITFYSPQDGVVDNLNIREGFYVQPGTTIMSIGSLEHVWVEAEIFERQANLVKVNQAVTMTLDFLPNETWHGKVDYIHPSLDAQNRTLRARLKFENKKHLLKPNMFAQILIYSNAKPNSKTSLAIPKEALIRNGAKDRVVLALGNGAFKSVIVKTGIITERHIEILKGLSEGERVVTSAQFLLDSESSKHSDFRRLSHPIETPFAHVKGKINSINSDNQTINISREAIKKWNRGPATLDFKVAESRLLNAAKAGEQVAFRFVIDNGDFIITNLSPKQKIDDVHKNHNMKLDDSNMKTDKPHMKMDHSKMKMEQP
jgi:Cu(I)/Ag(I) efflux system membrane fusion protein